MGGVPGIEIDGRRQGGETETMTGDQGGSGLQERAADHGA